MPPRALFTKEDKRGETVATSLPIKANERLRPPAGKTFRRCQADVVHWIRVTKRSKTKQKVIEQCLRPARQRSWFCPSHTHQHLSDAARLRIQGLSITSRSLPPEILSPAKIPVVTQPGLLLPPVSAMDEARWESVENQLQAINKKLDRCTLVGTDEGSAITHLKRENMRLQKDSELLLETLEVARDTALPIDREPVGHPLRMYKKEESEGKSEENPTIKRERLSHATAATASTTAPGPRSAPAPPSHRRSQYMRRPVPLMRPLVFDSSHVHPASLSPQGQRVFSASRTHSDIVHSDYHHHKRDSSLPRGTSISEKGLKHHKPWFF